MDHSACEGKWGAAKNVYLLVLQTIRLVDVSLSPRHRNSSCLGPLKKRRIITVITQKGKGKVGPSQTLWWEESMTSSIFPPQGTGWQLLPGINSRPLISATAFGLVVRTSCYSIKDLSYILFHSLCITTFSTVGGHLSVPSVDTKSMHTPDRRLLSFPLELYCCPLPHSCGAFWSVLVVKHWEPRYDALLSLTWTLSRMAGCVFASRGGGGAEKPFTPTRWTQKLLWIQPLSLSIRSLFLKAQETSCNTSLHKKRSCAGRELFLKTEFLQTDTKTCLETMEWLNRDEICAYWIDFLCVSWLLKELFFHSPLVW